MSDATGWRPIETAPKDAAVLLWFPGFTSCEVQVGVWRQWDEPYYGLEGEWIDRDHGEPFETVGDGQIWPTRWMPLPPAPAASADGAPLRVMPLSSTDGKPS